MSRIPIFLINLDRRPDRLQRMRERLAGIEFERMPAVDGATRLHEDARDCRLSASERACLASHLSVAREIVARGLDYACVLEDDVWLADDFAKFMQSSDWIPEGVELIKLETVMTKVLHTRGGHQVPSGRLCRLRSFHAGSAGYLVSLNAARKMVRLLASADLPVDNVIFDQALRDDVFGEIRQMVPALCMQECVVKGCIEDSDIQPRGTSFKSRLRAPAGILAKADRELRRIVMQCLRLWRFPWQKRAVIPMAEVRGLRMDAD